ncbi:MAG: FliH/SctL family protein, partial [Planctomycetota bacterium]
MAILRSRALASAPTTVRGVEVQRAAERQQAVIDDAVAEAAAASRSAAEAAWQAEREQLLQRAAAAEAKAEAVAADYHQRFSAGLAALETVPARLADLERAILTASEGACVALALDVAGRILRRCVDEGADWLAPVVADALRNLPDRRAIALHLHPLDAAALRAGIQGLTLPDAVVVIDDPDLQRGALVVHC